MVGRRVLGAALRALRSGKGWTAEHVANQLHFDVSKLSRLETGPVTAATGTSTVSATCMRSTISNTSTFWRQALSSQAKALFTSNH